MKHTALHRKPVTVLILQDSPAVRELVMQIFNSDPEITVLIEVSDGKKTRENV